MSGAPAPPGPGSPVPYRVDVDTASAVRRDHGPWHARRPSPRYGGRAVWQHACAARQRAAACPSEPAWLAGPAGSARARRRTITCYPPGNGSRLPQPSYRWAVPATFNVHAATQLRHGVQQPMHRLGLHDIGPAHQGRVMRHWLQTLSAELTQHEAVADEVLGLGVAPVVEVLYDQQP